MINNELKKRIISSIFIIPISIFFILKGSTTFLLFLAFFFLVSSYEWIRMNNEIKFKLFGILYLFASFYLTYLLREEFPLKIFLLILIICIFTDLGGYIFGKLFKGPKLTKISPQKTYSGALGSFFLSLIAAIIFIKYSYYLNFDYYQLSAKYNQSLELNNLIFVLIALVSLISQIGDLIISFFKRLAKVKDTGSFFPGHGGILDRIDGIILAMPTSYILLTLFN